MPLPSIEVLSAVLLSVAVVLLMNLASRYFSQNIANVDRRVVSEETKNLAQEYREQINAVRKACDERIAALRVEYEKRINSLEAQISILFELLRKSNMAPEMAEIERQHEVSKAENPTPKVLGIWPQSNLDTVGERGAVYNAGFAYMALVGEDVRRSTITRELRTGEYTILEIGAHGDETGIFINSVNFSAGWWANVLRNRGIYIAVLLACKSDSSIADAMKNAGVEYVVAVSGELDDAAAVEFAQEFYKIYAQGASVADAVTEARYALDNVDAEKIILR